MRRHVTSGQSRELFSANAELRLCINFNLIIIFARLSTPLKILLHFLKLHNILTIAFMRYKTK